MVSLPTCIEPDLGDAPKLSPWWFQPQSRLPSSCGTDRCCSREPDGPHRHRYRGVEVFEFLHCTATHNLRHNDLDLRTNTKINTTPQASNIKGIPFHRSMSAPATSSKATTRVSTDVFSNNHNRLTGHSSTAPEKDKEHPRSSNHHRGMTMSATQRFCCAREEAFLRETALLVVDVPQQRLPARRCFSAGRHGSSPNPTETNERATKLIVGSTASASRNDCEKPHLRPVVCRTKVKSDVANQTFRQQVRRRKAFAIGTCLDGRQSLSSPRQRPTAAPPVGKRMAQRIDALTQPTFALLQRLSFQRTIIKGIAMDGKGTEGKCSVDSQQQEALITAPTCCKRCAVRQT